ncbi:ribonuclease HI family protein [Vagococcus sp. PNs007]|uniref:Ribonuclease HI family protein n=1 Tax=Vagococcus proximus TaxID=2991417 RepID=A0ABT5WYR7_9ENTE|nr:ribonuclease HI family protein [Vagococcus proximus]MDF0478891.1 ribonuclease HI family protein [Vagococcus proximus]
MLKIYVDASTKGNPGPSGSGIVFIDGTIQRQYHFPLSVMSNHEAEFASLRLALTLALEQNTIHDTTLVYTDSKVVAETIDKGYTQNKLFFPYLKDIQDLLPKFPLIIIQWIPEKQNKGADHLARQGLQKAIKTIK